MVPTRSVHDAFRAVIANLEQVALMARAGERRAKEAERAAYMRGQAEVAESAIHALRTEFAAVSGFA